MKRKDDLRLENVGGQNLLIPLGSRVLDMNGMVVLNSTGSYIWDLLAEERSLEELVAAVVAQFDVGAERAGADVQTFVHELAQRGWIDL
jgi:hypothetical protein